MTAALAGAAPGLRPLGDTGRVGVGPGSAFPGQRCPAGRAAAPGTASRPFVRAGVPVSPLRSARGRDASILLALSLSFFLSFYLFVL